MRTLAVAAITSLIALAMASAAGAAPSISVVWTGTTGSGTTGGSSIASAAGDTLQLDVLITTTAPDGASFASVSVQDLGGGSLNAGTLINGVDDFQDSTGLSSALFTSGSYGGPALAFVSGVTCPYPATGNFSAALGGATCALLSRSFQGIDLGGGAFGSFVSGPGTNFTIAYTFTQARLIVAVVPEPATGGLLALGLGALVFIGRRRA